LFESSFLQTAYTAAFILVPIQLFIMMVAILCSNHVTLQFGRRLRPHIAYLEGHSDWKSWEQAQKKAKEEATSALDCDTKGLPYQFSPIDLFSQSPKSMDNEIQPAQSTTSALGGPTLVDTTRKRSIHRQIQR
jgi:hypothetical protein